MRFTYLFLLVGLIAPTAAQVGALDPTFDGDGVRVDSFDVWDQVWNILVLDDGAILTFGSSEDANPSTRDARLTRYTPDGTLAWSWTDPFDGCFGGPGTPGSFFGGVIEPDGRLLTASYNQYGCSGSERDFVLRRVDPATGAILDEAERPTFHGFSDEPWGGVVRLPDGKAIVAGYACSDATAQSHTRDLALVRYNVDFTIDDTFGTGGEVLIDIAGDYDFVYDIALQPDGKVVGTGFTYDGSQYDLLVFRLLPDGTLDDTFGDGGLVIEDFFGFNDSGRDLVFQPDGKIVVAGNYAVAIGAPAFLVARYNPDGSRDTGFGADGLAVVDFTGLPASASGILLQPDGKLIATGQTQTGAGGTETYDFATARLLPGGALDPTWDGDGRSVADAGSGIFDSAWASALAPDGDLVMVGYTVEEVGGDPAYDAALARFIGDTPVVANEPEADQPVAPILHVPAPNPFAAHTTLRYDVAEAGPVRIAVYDLLGREVAVLVDEERAAGRYDAVFDGHGLASGIYVVRLSADGFTQTERVTLLR